MAKGLKVGDRVRAIGVKARGEAWARAHGGADWRSTMVHGVVAGHEGRKIRVAWADGATSLLGGKALALELDSDPPHVAAVAAVVHEAQPVSEPEEAGSVADSCPDPSVASSAESDEDEEAGVSVHEPELGGGAELLHVHGLEWTRGEVVEDSRSSPNYATALLWPDGRGGDVRSPLDYWRMMFPQASVERILAGTNAALPTGKPALTEQELWRFLALLLAMAVYDLGPYRSYWQETQDHPGEPFVANPLWGRFMTRNRFEDLLRFLRLDTYTAGELQDDKWRPVRAFVNDFNAARARHVHPGWMICVDESISSWRGRDGTVLDGMPHVTKIKRKPQGVGLEMKDACDVMSGIMLRLELCEGKEAMLEKPFQRELGAGTATLLRLTKPWWETGRIVCADSAFASVKSAVELRKRGLHFLGLVKTATRRFPKQYLDSYPLAERGAHVAVTSVADGIPLIGCAWNDRKRKLVVGTCGTTLAGSPHQKKRLRVSHTGETEVYYKQVQRPRIVELYFSGAPAVDVHNHYRQGGLALEKGLQTKIWWMRVFCTILGIIETDAYVAYIRFCPDARGLSHRQFTLQLAASLRDVASGAATRAVRRPRTQPTLAPLPRSSATYPSHALKPLLECERFQNRRGTATRAKLTCEICKRQAHSYCASCTAASGRTIAVCGSGTGRECLLRHAAQRAIADE
jgi:hypothetical protein